MADARPLFTDDDISRRRLQIAVQIDLGFYPGAQWKRTPGFATRKISWASCGFGRS
jgi:hypothetical protein